MNKHYQTLCFILLLNLGCQTEKRLHIQLVDQKMLVATDVQKGYLKEYYIVSGIASDSLLNSKMDSLAIALGRTKGMLYDLYSVNFFYSSQNLKRANRFFRTSDSLTLTKRRSNIANYFFNRGVFWEKQSIKNGKILPPKYDSVAVIKKSDPVIQIIN